MPRVRSVKITKTRRIGGRLYMLLTKGFDTKAEAEEFVRDFGLRRFLLIDIVKGTDGKWYVYGAARLQYGRARVD
ncbi:MAG: hypothetical protein DRN68_04360 [Thaumarchaeota archaeon]|nr:MAG: hypothetical protein DRN68_04360 [Nitrososphaerota archaeon]